MRMNRTLAAVMVGMLASIMQHGSAVAATADSLPDSQYEGKHYVKNAESFRKCVMWRESHGRYRADGQYGSGAYQFVQSTWRVYAARAGYPEWADRRPYLAPRYVQDEVFWLALNPLPNKRGLEGRHHWDPKHALTIGKSVKACS